MTEADLNDIYSNMPCGMRTESLTQPIDPSIQEVITTVIEAIGKGITDIVATPDMMEDFFCTWRPGSYNATQDGRNAKRLKVSDLCYKAKVSLGAKRVSRQEVSSVALNSHKISYD